LHKRYSFTAAISPILLLVVYRWGLRVDGPKRALLGGMGLMLKLLGTFATACGLLTGQAVYAADMPVKAPPIVVSTFSWSGYYIGGHIGFASGRIRTSSFTGDLLPPFFVPGPILIPGDDATIPGTSARKSSWLGGVQAGRNWQTNRYVFGIEADLSGLDLNAAASATVARFPAPDTETTIVNRRAEVDWIASFRGRLGYAVVERTLAYVTGGLAVAGVRAGASTTVIFPPTAIFAPVGTHTLSSSQTHTRFGWTLGGGLEWAYSNAWRFAVEYRHTDLGRFSTPIAVPDGFGTAFFTGSSTARLTIDQVTVRANWAFGAR
jgi:outer membrane immunogenic protein